MSLLARETPESPYLERFRTLSYYEMLDVSPDSGSDAISAAYRRSLQMFDPMSVATYSILNDSETAEMSRLVEIAFSVLRDPVERRKYDRDLERVSQVRLSEAPVVPITPTTRMKAEPRGPVQTSFPFLTPVYAVENSDIDQPGSDMPRRVKLIVPLPEALPTPPTPPKTAVVPVTTTSSKEITLVCDVESSTPVPPPRPVAGVVTFQDFPTVPPKSSPESTPADAGPQLTGVPPVPPAPPAPQIAAAAAANLESLSIGPDTVFTGALLKTIRELHNLNVADIAAITKVTRTSVENLEKELYRELPALIYLRGHLTQYAKILKLDPQRVASTYINRMKEKTGTLSEP
ncbi:MAG: helix-turn-helix domain-containing protein [Myxococcota bacterium]|jgi:DNA-binding XRE family transcriptional regulator